MTLPPAADVPGHHTLHPGDVACVSRGERMVTLLGSCVAVVLTDPRRTVGAMCHVVHVPGGSATGVERDSRWGDVALDTMFHLLRARGIEPRLCEAYVYGGGNMFPALFGATHVGEGNSGWVLGALDASGIHVLHRDVGGTAYRRLAWTVGPGTPTVEAVSV